MIPGEPKLFMCQKITLLGSKRLFYDESDVKILEFGKSFDSLITDWYCVQGDIYKHDDKDSYIHFWLYTVQGDNLMKTKTKLQEHKLLIWWILCSRLELLVDNYNDQDKDNDIKFHLSPLGTGCSPIEINDPPSYPCF